MKTTHDDENRKTIEAHLRSALMQLGQIDLSGETEIAGAIDDPQPGIENPDQHEVSRR